MWSSKGWGVEVMVVIDFESTLNLRIKNDDKRKIVKVVSKNQDIYFNESHFVRCAILKLLREFEDNGKRIRKH